LWGPRDYHSLQIATGMWQAMWVDIARRRDGNLQITDWGIHMTRKSAIKSKDGNLPWSAGGSLAPLDVRQRYGIDEAARYLRISRARLYQKIAAGEIRLLKDGRRSFVPGSAIVAAST